MTKWWKRESSAEELEWRVRRALHHDSRLRDFEAPRIRIAAGDGGEVALAGAVSTAQARDLAEQVVRRVKGIVALRNELRTDAELATELRSALERDPQTRGLVKDSAVFQGIVELRGSATYDTQLAAMKMAEALDGARGVANYLQLAASDQPADVRKAA